MKRYLFVILLCFLFPPHNIYADTAPMSTVAKDIITTSMKFDPVRFIASNESDLNMENEVVNIYVYKTQPSARGNPEDGAFHATIEATFNIKNYGQEQTKGICFPFSYDGMYGMYQNDAFNTFHVTIDGKKTEYEKLYSDGGLEFQYRGWAVWDTHFNSGETKTITVEYTLWMEGSPISNLKYVLRTGAFWRDKIKDAKINVILLPPLSPDRLACAEPDGYIPTKDGVKWVYKDLKPVDDISLYFIRDDEQLKKFRAVNHVLVKSPESFMAHYRMAQYLLNGPSSRYEQWFPSSTAIGELKETIRLNPKFPDAYLDLANIYSQYSSWHGAFDHYREGYMKGLPKLELSLKYYERYLKDKPNDKEAKKLYEATKTNYIEIKKYLERN